MNAPIRSKKDAVSHYAGVAHDARVYRKMLRIDPINVECALDKAVTPQTRVRMLRAIAERDWLELGTILGDAMHAYLAAVAEDEVPEDPPASRDPLTASERNGRPMMASEI